MNIKHSTSNTQRRTRKAGTDRLATARCHKCPIAVCNVRNVPNTAILCDHHWNMVPPKLRAAIDADAKARSLHLVESTKAAIAHVSRALGLRACKVCNCTDGFSCANGCYWVADDLCNRCSEESAVVTRHQPSTINHRSLS